MDTKELKQLIQASRYIEVKDKIREEMKKFISDIEGEKFLEISEHPNIDNFMQLISEYEKITSPIIDFTIILLDNVEEKHYKEILLEIVMKIIYSKKNEKDAYGYMWRNMNYYPLLLILYTIGLFCIKDNRYNLLYELFNIQLMQRYFGYSEMKYYKTSLIERVNCYHLFNNIDGLDVSVINYFVDSSDTLNNKETYKYLKPNNRIYSCLTPKIKELFINEAFFNDYFDLFEYFIGLDIMYKRIKAKSNILFAPYGRRFWLYSQTGMFFHNKDNFVSIFTEEVLQNKNNVLKAGFFDGNTGNFEIAIKEYVNLLQRILR